MTQNTRDFLFVAAMVILCGSTLAQTVHSMSDSHELEDCQARLDALTPIQAEPAAVPATLADPPADMPAAPQISLDPTPVRSGSVDVTAPAAAPGSVTVG